MTDTPLPIVARRSEHGSALLGVVLLLMLMSALAAALAVSGETETLISRNQRDGARAQAAAEAGLSHALELATSFIFEWKNNGFGSADAAIDSLLAGVDADPADTADNGGLDERTGIAAGEDIPIGGPNVAIAGGINVRYTAMVMDEDTTAPAGQPENANLADDLNKVLVVRATGFGPDNTTVTVEAMISAFPFPAIATNNDLTLSGSYQVLGSSGGVHTNADLDGNGSSATIEQMATAAGAYDYSDPDIDGFGGAARIPIPEVNASDYLSLANFILRDDGTMLTVATSAVCSSPCNNWSYNAGGDGEWRLDGSAAVTGTYYSETDVLMNGSFGPVAMSIFAEGSIQMGGSAQIYPSVPGVLFVTDEDLKIAGTPGSVVSAGKMLAHEQIELGGNTTVNAMVIAEDAANVSNLVTANIVHGSVIVTYNGDLNDDAFAVSGWRDVR